MKKRILIAALTAAMASSIFGVTVNAAERELNINWLSSRSASESAILAIQDIAKQYQEENPDLDFNFEIENISDRTAYLQKLKILAASDELPEWFDSDPDTWFADIVADGKAYSFEDLYKELGMYDQIFPISKEYARLSDGSLNLMTLQCNTEYFFYNKDLFEQAGIEAPEVAYATWDEFFEACDKLKEAGITPIGMDSADSGWLTNLWMSALIGTNGDAGNEWMNTMYPTDYNTPEVIEAAENIQKMFQNYTTPDAVGGKYDPMATHFFNGEVAMFPNGPWMIPDFSETEKAPEGFYDKVGIMLLPGNGMEMVPTPGDMVGATDPEKIEAAVAFLKFETTPENQIKALEMTGLQPVSDNLEVPETLSESDPLMAQALEIQGKAEVTYGQNQAYWYQNTIDTFSTELPELAYGNITAEEFCTKLSEAAAKNVE